MRSVFILLLSITYIFAASIVDTKEYQGETFYIVKSKAEVMTMRDNKENVIGKDLVFDNLEGKVSLPRTNTFQDGLKEHSIGDKIDIYYAVNKNETNKILYDVYFHKDDVRLDNYYTTNHIEKTDDFDKSHIPTSSIYSNLSNTSVSKLVYQDDKYQYLPDVPTVLYIFLVLALFYIYKILRRSRAPSVLLFAISFIAIPMFVINMIKGKNVYTFDMPAKKFYEAKTVDEAINHANRIVDFNDIYGFQILKTRDCISINAKPKDSSSDCFDAYSLNLVLNNYDRINLEAHADRQQIIENAQKLSIALNRPILDQTKN